MVKRIAFLSRLPALEHFSKTWGIDYLSQNDFEVFFLDVSYLIDGKNSQNLNPNQAQLANCETIVIRRLVDLDTFVKDRADSTVFIDFVGALTEFNLTTGRVYKILKKYSAKFYIMADADIPSAHYIPNDSSSTFLGKVKKVLRNPNLLLNFFERKLILVAVKLDILYQKPQRIFGIKDSSIVDNCIKRYGLSDSVVTQINSRDYDIYLEFKRETSQKITSTKTCVFLDEGHTNHPDWELFGRTPLNEAEYVSSMNHFFDCVEEKTGLAVVIAGHPKSAYSAENHPYGKRDFIHGNTVELVAKSKMVIAHSSTSINFPALFAKPIVLVVTSEFKNRIYMMHAVESFAKALGVILIDVDSAEEVKAFDINIERHCDYNSYLHKYVRNKEPINKLIWEIVADAARKDLESQKILLV